MYDIPCYKLCNLCNFCKNCYFCDVVEQALLQLMKNDAYLLENKISERSQTHKLAEYLQLLLPQWNVDCEYNRKLKLTKTLDFSSIVNGIKGIIEHPNIEREDIKALHQQLNADDIAIATEDDIENYSALLFSVNSKNGSYIKKVFPDIIAHMRGTMENKIVIEAKKAGNIDPKARLFDLIKLALFTKIGGEYEYQVGFFIDIPEHIPEKIKITCKRDRFIQKLVPDSNVWIINVLAR